MSKWDGYVPTPVRRRLSATSSRVPRIDRFWSSVNATGGPDACWPWLGPLDAHGYGFISRHGRAHRLALQFESRTEIPSTSMVIHSCDNPACCNPQHLRVGTHTDNVMDRVSRKRSAKGNRNGRAVLSTQQVLEIFKAEGLASAIAKRHGVSERTVRDIQSHRTWSWLTNPGGEFQILSVHSKLQHGRR